jgi:hypothetical protein
MAMISRLGRTIIFTIVIWSFLVGVYGVATVASKLSLPPSGDTYAHTPGFQVLQFVAFKLPAMLSVLVASLAVVVTLWQVARSPLATSEKRRLRASLSIGMGLFVVAALWHNAIATTLYNPYFQRDEQLALQFLTHWAPVFYLAVGVALAAQYWWLNRRAS